MGRRLAWVFCWIFVLQCRGAVDYWRYPAAYLAEDEDCEDWFGDDPGDADGDDSDFDGWVEPDEDADFERECYA